MSQTLAPTRSASPTASDVAPGLRRPGGALGIAGAVVMTSGAVLLFTGGSDWFAAVQDRSFAAFLDDVAGHTTLMYVHLAAWILGATLMSMAVLLFAASSPVSAAALIARFAATAATAVVMIAFPLVIGVIYALAGHPEQELAATALTKTAYVADDLATVLILGVGAGLAVLAGRGTWAPRWLGRFAAVNAVIAALYLVPVDAVTAVTSGLLVISGQALVVAMGIVGLRERSLGTGDAR